MYSFDYVRPASMEEVSTLLSENVEARPLAGGMSLVPVLKLRLADPPLLVDLGGIETLRGVRRDEDELTVGAMTTHRTVATSATVREYLPGLSKLAGGIGDPQVRYRGTMGGSIANADPAADYPAAVLGLGASVRTNRRMIAGDDFFGGLYETALAPGELITSVSYRIPREAAYMKFASRSSRFAIVGVMMARYEDEVRVAITGAASHVFRVPEFEQALQQDFSAAALEGLSPALPDLNNDGHATGDFRAHLIGVLAGRAVEACVQGGTGRERYGA